MNKSSNDSAISVNLSRLMRLILGISLSLTDWVNAVICGHVSASRAGLTLWATADSSGYAPWTNETTNLSSIPAGLTDRLRTSTVPSSLSSRAPTLLSSVLIAPGGISPPNFLTKDEKVLCCPENGSAFGFPVVSKNSGSECQRCSTSQSGVDLTTRECSPFSILSLRRLTSLRVNPVITATLDIFVGRPRKPYSELATSTNAALATSVNSRNPMPHRSRILAIGRRITKNASRICR